MPRTVAALFVCLGLLSGGCAIMGRQQVDHRLDPSAIGQVEKGMTRTQVQSILGAPQEIIFSNREHDPLREHAYVYEYSCTKYTGISFVFINFGNMDRKRDRVVVFFDAEGHVEGIGSSLRGESSSYGFPFGE